MVNHVNKQVIMHNNIVEKFKKLIDSIEGNQNPNVEKFVHDALMLLTQIKDKLSQGTEQEKKEMLEVSKQLQKLLEEKAKAAFRSTGMSPDQLEKYLAKRENFTEEQWEAFQKAQKEMDEYQKNLLMEAMPRSIQSKHEKDALAKKVAPAKRIRFQG